MQRLHTSALMEAKGGEELVKGQALCLKPINLQDDINIVYQILVSESAVFTWSQSLEGTCS